MKGDRIQPGSVLRSSAGVAGGVTNWQVGSHIIAFPIVKHHPQVVLDFGATEPATWYLNESSNQHLTCCGVIQASDNPIGALGFQTGHPVRGQMVLHAARQPQKISAAIGAVSDDIS
jgi:hypothetical protein